MTSPSVCELGLCLAPKGHRATLKFGLSSEESEEPRKGFYLENDMVKFSSSEKQKLHRVKGLWFQAQTKYPQRPEYLKLTKVPPTGDTANGSLAAGPGTWVSWGPRATEGHSEPCHPQGWPEAAGTGSTPSHPRHHSANTRSSINAASRVLKLGRGGETVQGPQSPHFRRRN